jgi:hypothetical protein
MAEHPTALGHLTQSQSDEARSKGVTHTDFLQVVLQRIADEHEGMHTPPVSVQGKKAAIIIGHGPDWEKQAVKVKGTKHIVIATDICAKPLIAMGIIPNYIVTFEESPKVVKDEMFPYEDIKKHNIGVWGSKLTRPWLGSKLRKYHVKMHRFTDYPGAHATNVGIFGAMFARWSLLVDKIILIGMNCWGGEHAYPFVNWYHEWRKFVHQCNLNTIINCTEGGILYFERVTPADYSTLTIHD